MSRARSPALTAALWSVAITSLFWGAVWRDAARLHTAPITAPKQFARMKRRAQTIH